MAFIQYLNFDRENLPLPDSHELELRDVKADSGGETESGYVQRDIVQTGVVSIAASFLDILRESRFMRGMPILPSMKRGLIWSRRLCV